MPTTEDTEKPSSMDIEDEGSDIEIEGTLQNRNQQLFIMPQAEILSLGIEHKDLQCFLLNRCRLGRCTAREKK